MLIINSLGVGLIALIIWWFWLYKPKEAVVSTDGITVTVENGTYQPSRIKLSGGQPATLQFLRKDGSPCAATVLFPALNINEELPLGRPKSITLPGLTKGEYAFHCQMQMYRGTLLVE
jgi:plastocyanin domain-containing protein